MTPAKGRLPGLIILALQFWGNSDVQTKRRREYIVPLESIVEMHLGVQVIKLAFTCTCL
jgi:hypothetical protein